MAGSDVVNQIATGVRALVVGAPDPAFDEIAALLKRRSLRLELLPEKQLLYELARLAGPVAATNLYLFNLLTPFRYDWRDMVRRLRLAEPDSGIVVVLDSPARDAIDDAITAGVDELLYRAELSSVVLVRQRIGHLIPSATAATDASREVSVPTAGTTNALESVLDIAVPELRALSGRLDATKIAERLDVPVARLASVVGVSRQALSQTPDSPRIQAALKPIARVLGALGRVFSPDDERKWLHTSHPYLERRTPLEAIMSRQADVVARMLDRSNEAAD